MRSAQAAVLAGAVAAAGRTPVIWFVTRATMAASVWSGCSVFRPDLRGRLLATRSDPSGLLATALAQIRAARSERTQNAVQSDWTLFNGTVLDRVLDVSAATTAMAKRDRALILIGYVARFDVASSPLSRSTRHRRASPSSCVAVRAIRNRAVTRNGSRTATKPSVARSPSSTRGSKLRTLRPDRCGVESTSETASALPLPKAKRSTRS